MFRVVKMNSDGTLNHEAVENPDYNSLTRALLEHEIKSFTVTLVHNRVAKVNH